MLSFAGLAYLVYFVLFEFLLFCVVLCSIADQTFRAHDLRFMRRRVGRVMMLLRYRSDAKFEVDGGIGDCNVGVDTNVFVLMLMPVLTSCVDFDRFHVKLSVLVSFVVLVGAACKGDAIRGLLSMCQAQRRAAGNRAGPESRPRGSRKPEPRPGSPRMPESSPRVSRKPEPRPGKEAPGSQIQPKKPKRPEPTPRGSRKPEPRPRAPGCQNPAPEFPGSQSLRKPREGT